MKNQNNNQETRPKLHQKDKIESSTDDLYQYDEDFRDSIATVDKRGKRVWIYPKKPSGSYHKKRTIVTIILLGILFSGPFLKVNGHPFMLFNLFERKFIFFGATFWPQDFFLLALTLIALFVFIILFTVTFGRLWCGWACPQTLFMEMVFRKIEYLIEGDASQQRKLDSGGWTLEKITKKGLKQIIFMAISLLISHTVMAYIIGLEDTVKIVSQPPSEHISGFLGLMFFTFIFYGVFSYFREQACTVVCPYGRLQGVLLVKESIIVAYDYIRGEPRGKIEKVKKESSKGDCIDCKLCVHVCPTGIDIRNGTQLECVNCTACIDACDDVMEKVNRPKGLIRYSSDTAIKSGKNKIFTTRVAAYSVVLVVLLTLLSFLLATRSDIDASFHRVPGMTAQKTTNGYIRNFYNLQIINKTFDKMDLTLKMENIPTAEITLVGSEKMVLEENGRFEGTIIILIPEKDVKPGRNTFVLGVYNNGLKIDEIETNFGGTLPGKKL
ncbi:MAG: cytochrome c oxidase accessory protein CcoG [Cyclobacteriaceae bacterium]|nr:cytochrome c oxidase accessory protein CcoG [Cyclobacteriaceae bacterium]